MNKLRFIKEIINKEFNGALEGNIDILVNLVIDRYGYLFKRYNIDQPHFNSTDEYIELYSCLTGAIDEIINKNFA